MTGFGEAHCQQDGLAVAVEVRAINNRYFKLSIRASEGYGPLEPRIEEVVRQSIRRGTMQVNLRVDRLRSPEELQINAAVLGRYRVQLQSLCRQWDLPRPVPIEALLLLPGVVDEQAAALRPGRTTGRGRADAGGGPGEPRPHAGRGGPGDGRRSGGQLPRTDRAPAPSAGPPLPARQQRLQRDRFGQVPLAIERLQLHAVAVQHGGVDLEVLRASGGDRRGDSPAPCRGERSAARPLRSAAPAPRSPRRLRIGELEEPVVDGADLDRHGQAVLVAVPSPKPVMLKSMAILFEGCVRLFVRWGRAKRAAPKLLD